MIFIIIVYCFLGVPKIVCSFRSSSTSGCEWIDYKKTWPKKILPLTSCQNSVHSYLQKISINHISIENECALIKMNAGFFNEDDGTLTIYPKHRYMYYICQYYIYLSFLVNKQLSLMSVQYILYSQTLVYFILICCPT